MVRAPRSMNGKTEDKYEEDTDANPARRIDFRPVHDGAT
jgi:hypothetical protein